MRKALGADLLQVITGPAWVDFGFAALPIKADGTLGEGHSNWFGALQQYFKLEHFKQGALKYGSATWSGLEKGVDDHLDDGKTYAEASKPITAKADGAIHEVVISGMLVPTLKAVAEPGGCADNSIARGYQARLKRYLELCAKDGTLDKVHSGTAMYRT